MCIVSNVCQPPFSKPAIFVFVCVFFALKGHSFYNIAIFDLEVILLLQCVSTQIAQWFWWRSQKLVFKMVVQDGYGGHFGFLISKILAIYHLHINLLLHCKFQLNWPCGLQDVQNRFSISPPWWFVQRLGHRAYLVLEKKIFKGFYHIWARRSSWQMDRDYFNNLSFPCPKEATFEIWATLAPRLQRRSCLLVFFLFFFFYKCMGHYKCTGKQTWPRCKKVKHHCRTIILATLVDLQSPMICAKIQPQNILGSGEDF